MLGATQKITAALIVSGTSLAIGYYFGSHPRLEPTNSPTSTQPEQDNSDDENDDEDIHDGDFSIIKAGFMEPCKLVLVVRTDLKMTPGNVAAQCGHATLACYKALQQKNPSLVRHWESTGQAKIALKASSEEQIHELEAIAKSLNLCARIIQDGDSNQVAEGTETVLGIGPAPVGLINQVTGQLKLF